MKTKLLLALISISKFIAIVILDVIIFFGVASIGFFLIQENIKEVNNTLYTYLLGCAVGTVGGYVIYMLHSFFNKKGGVL